MSLDKSRKEQYRKKVEESFPEKYAFVDIDQLQQNLGGLGFNAEEQKQLMEAIKDSATIFNKAISLRYGQNPGGPAAFYAEEGAKGPCSSNIELLKEGKGLGYINIGDLDLAQRLAKSLYGLPASQELFEDNAKNIAVIVKHEMPSGVARGFHPLTTYEAAWDTDSLSSFGGVVVLTYDVTPDIAESIVIPDRNTEVIAAPSYTEEALKILEEREPLRVVKMDSFENDVTDNGLEFKRTAGGLLMENRTTTKIYSPDDIDCISEAKPTAEDLEAAIFAWHVAAYTRSNAIVIGTKDKIHGIGSGQRSRIDAADDAIRLSERGYGAEGTFMASDAFMPATDVVELAAENGIRGVIYPLGSAKDRQVIEVANYLGLILLITRKPGDKGGGERCFLHR